MLSAFSRMQQVLSTTTSASSTSSAGRHAVGLEQPGDALGVVLVHLAPEGADEVAAGLGHGRQATSRPALQVAGDAVTSGSVDRRGRGRRGDGSVGWRSSTDERMAVRRSPSISMSAKVGMHTRSMPAAAT